MLLFFCIAGARGSMKIVKKESESGHSCLISLWSVMLCELILLVVMVALGELCSVLIQQMNDSPKPSLWGVVIRKSYRS